MAAIEFTTNMIEATIDVEQGTKLKAGDTLPVFKAQLLDNGDPYDLTDKTPELHMNEEGTDISSKTIDGVAMTVVDETAGEVEYQWDSSETETEGDYNLEVVVVDDTSSNERTFPTDGFVNVRIYEDLQ
jgi:hypothetical protein